MPTKCKALGNKINGIVTRILRIKRINTGLEDAPCHVEQDAVPAERLRIIYESAGRKVPAYFLPLPFWERVGEREVKDKATIALHSVVQPGSELSPIGRHRIQHKYMITWKDNPRLSP